MKTAYFDCFSGASGDMVVGALVDAGAGFDFIQKGLESLGVPGFSVSAEKVLKSGISATQFRVHVANAEFPHRHLRHILDIIEKASLPTKVHKAAEKTFRRIAECEAAIHGTTIENIHFHEVGAVDSIVDVVAAHLAHYNLGIERVISSALHAGSGEVECAHGTMPVPAPATAALLKDVPWYGGEVAAELVTPTGAALITQWAEAYGPMPPMKPSAVGYGSGTHNIHGRPNVLRVIIGETKTALPGIEPIVIVEANVDDMAGELFPPLLAELLEKGARDAFLTPIIGKKGRPAHVLTVLCDEEKLHDIVAAMFQGSTTLGIRMRTEQRVCLERDWRQVSTPWGEVRIKRACFDGERTTASPEFEDCRALAEKAGVPVRRVYEAALAAAYQEGKNHD
jgi:pyridinium-3,5-bisthiocarboxylic acid mononucleotide nickel chelatase